MAGYRVIQQGEHVCRIAKEHGFGDYRTVWNHPNNAELKKKRENPNVLLPGDVVFVPDRDMREAAARTDQRHRFLLRASTLKLRLTLEDLYERPIANAQCDLTLEGDVRHVTTDAKGRIEQEIPATVHDATLVVRDAGTAFKDTEIRISIGDLDPVTEISGQLARLNNLGYFVDETDCSDDAGFRSAVEEFQCDHQLAVDGICGAMTQAKLKQVHGC